MHFLQMAAQARAAAEPHAVTYVDFLTVTLTAVCAILTALAIIIAVAAIWGYSGIKKETTRTVQEAAKRALEAKLDEYPDAKEMFDLFHDMRTLHERQKLLSSQLVARSPATRSANSASKKADEATKGKDSLAKDYPGKGK